MTTFTGTAGNDNLAGTTGADTMIGLAGNDSYTVNNCDDAVVEAPGEGIDKVTSSVHFDLGADIENLVLTGTAAIDAKGNDLSNSITGNGGGNRLTAGDGVDTVAAGAGDDTVIMDGFLTAADKLDGGTGFDTLRLNGDYATVPLAFSPTTAIGFERIRLAAGNSYSLTLDAATNATALLVDGNSLGVGESLNLNGAAETTGTLTAFGGAGADTLIGGGGADHLRGGGNADVLTGGAGIDTASYANSGGGVTVDLTNNANNAGADAAGDLLAGIENLLGSDFDDTLTGDSGNNLLSGGEGNDSLVAGVGNDKLLGGSGNDMLDVGGSLGTTDTVDGGDGQDLLLLAGNYAAGFAFGANVTNIESIVLADGNSYKFTLNAATNNGGLLVDGSALTGSNSLNLNGAAETISGLTALGGAGNDSLMGGGVGDRLVGGTGNDTLLAGAGDDVIDQAAALNALDRIDGGAGNDKLTLAGDYAAGVTFGTTTVTNVELIELAAGFSYQLTLDGATNSATMIVDGRALGLGESLSLDGAKETASPFTLSGGAGDDKLIGGGGADSLVGGLGADTLTGGLGIDTVSYAEEAGGVVVDLATNGNGGEAAGDVLTGVEVLIGSGFSDYMLGNALNNRLVGGLGNDTLGDGTGGIDTLIGGSGDNYFAMFDKLTATDSIDGGIGYDTLNLNGNYGAGLVFGATTALDIEAIELAGGFSYNLTLNDKTNGSGLFVDGSFLGVGETLRLNAAAETLDSLNAFGGAGNDTLIAGTGSDLLDGGFGNDSLSSGNGNNQLYGQDGLDTLVGGTGNDILDGGAGNDSLSGGAGINTFTGGAGSDTIVGGTGLDTAAYSGSGAAVAIDLNLAGPQSGGDAAGDKLAGIEGVVGSGFNDTLTGNGVANSLSAGGGADRLDGGAGNDTLEGGAGADTLLGGLGMDIASYAGSASGVTVDLNLAVQAGGGDEAGDSFTGIEGAIGSGVADTLTGTAGGDFLAGGGGFDQIIAGAGNDTLRGDGGGDTFKLGASLTAADQIDGGQGFDTLELDGNYAAGVTLGAATLTSVETIDLVAGNSYKLTLADGNNSSSLTIDGGALGGANTLYVGGAAETSAGLHAIGGAANDTLIGGSGEDTFEGGQGADSIVGGTGSDTVDYTASGGPLIVNLNLTTGQTGGDASGDRLTGIENVKGSSFNDHLTGTIADNVLRGGDGDDTLIGGAGGDLLDGGANFDIVDYTSSTKAVTINLQGNRGSAGDAAGDSFIGVERVIGSTLGDTFFAGANVHDVDGGAGNDLVSYVSELKFGIDIDLTRLGGQKNGNADGDILTNIESVIGTKFDDILVGSAAGNRLEGGEGSDTLDAGAGGDDSLLGGAKNDEVRVGGTLTAKDQLDGGEDLKNDDPDDLEQDVLVLDGDYSAGVVFTATTVRNFESIQLKNGFDYNLKVDNATNDDGKLVIDATALGAGDNLIFNAALETTHGYLIKAGNGAHTLTGGTQVDTLDYAASGGGVVIDLSNSANNAGDAAGDILVGIENLVGTKFDDTLRGDAKNNRFEGDDGADVFDGAAGVDTVSYANSGAVILDLGNVIASGGDAAGDQFTSIEIVIGSNSSDEIYGDGAANKIDGGKGADTLSGGLGNDTLLGGDGDDVFVESSLVATDRIDGGDGADKLTLDGNYSAGVTFSATTAIGVESILVAGGNDYRLTLNNATNGSVLVVDGSALGAGDTLYLNGAAETANKLVAVAGADADTLIGGGGADTLTGGAGADRLTGGGGGDTANYAGAGGPVVIDLRLTTAQSGGDAAGDILATIENVIGSDAADTLTGNTGANVLEGGKGADTIDGGAGIDLASYAGAGAPVIVDLGVAGPQAGAGDVSGDVLIGIEGLLGSAGDDMLIGNGSGNHLDGGEGDDTIVGECGNDTIIGGSGVDRIELGSDFTALDRIDGGEGMDIVVLDGNYAAGVVLAATTLVNVERLDLTKGNSYKFTLIDATNAGTLTVDGSTLEAEDTLYINGALELSGKLIASGGLAADTLIGGTGGDVLEGNAGNDSLVGNAGADEIDGGAGNDSLSGGLGNDLFTAGSGVDSVSGGDGNDGLLLEGNLTALDRVDGGVGDDLLLLDGDYAAGVVFTSTTVTNVETIMLLAGNNYKFTLDQATNTAGLLVDGSQLSAADSLILNGLAETTSSLTALGGKGSDSILGGGGGDTLVGGEGGDTLDGAGGIDLVDYSGSAAGVTVHLANSAKNAGGDAAGDSLTNIENLIGSKFDDNLTGSAVANLIDGGSGADTMDGGAGIDTVTYAEGEGDTVVVSLDSGLGFDGIADGDTLSNIENLIGTELSMIGNVRVGDWLIGNDGVNVIDGRNGDDRLEGLGGADKLIGGEGRDFLIGGDGADTIDGGTDRDWVSYRDSNTAVTVNLTLTTAQVSSGNAANDLLIGIENVEGSNFNDKLTGDGSSNVLAGGAGADTLDGGGGANVADYFTSSAAVQVNLALVGAQVSTGDASGDVLININTVWGSVFDDKLTGDGNNNALFGDNGADTLTGGLGSDVFEWNSVGEGVDLVTDFKAGIGGDTLQIGDVLENYDGNIDGFVRFVAGGSGVLFQVDFDGGGDNFVTLATLAGLSATTINAQQMLDDGNLDPVTKGGLY
jgi:Ca2+-binding RTX toxin-like protein